MKKTFLFLTTLILSLLVITSCEDDEVLTEIPNEIILGKNEYELYTNYFNLPGIELSEGLTGYWKVLENTDTYTLSDSSNPNCQFNGELLGQYKLRWTVTNGKDEMHSDVTIKMIGFTDSISNEQYKVVRIGDQIWMAENLKTSKYNNGVSIPLVTDATEWAGLSTPAYCWYNNDQTTYGDTYGALYNWYTVNTGNLCPAGWHLPTDEEWTILETFVENDGHSGTEGTALKSTSGWYNSGNGTDDYGFSALPGGKRNSLAERPSWNGMFIYIGNDGNWWSSTEYDSSRAYFRCLSDYNNIVDCWRNIKSQGFSVRCVKD